MSALVHHDVSLDKAAPKQKFQYHFCGKLNEVPHGSSGAITIALIPSESRETKLEMTTMDGVKFRELGSLSNDDGDGNENGKVKKVWIGKTAALHVHHAFLYIS